MLMVTGLCTIYLACVYTRSAGEVFERVSGRIYRHADKIAIHIDTVNSEDWQYDRDYELTALQRRLQRLHVSQYTVSVVDVVHCYL